MRKSKCWLIAALSALALVLLLAVGCTGGSVPPADTAKLTLDPAGGTLAETEFDVEIGSSLSEALKDLTPTPEEGLTFGGWFQNGKAIENGATMPEEGLTLTAKYLASYTVRVYLEKAEGGYGEPQTESGTAWYGEAFSYEPAVDHFELDGTREENRVSSPSLGKNEVFTAYLSRVKYRVSYYPNVPQGESAQGSMPSVSVRYGESAEIAPSSYEISPFYRFAGWAAEPQGGVVYRPGDRVTPEENLPLYAVWDRAYVDRFGGYDAIFLPSGEEGVALLVREGLGERRGTVDGQGLFVFAEGEEILRGRVSADGKFSYYRSAQENLVYSHLNAYTDTLADDGATLTFDGFDRAIYSENGETREGVYSYDPETALYHFVYDGGTEGFEFFLETLSGEEGETPVYLRQGAEANLYLGLELAGEAGSDSTYADLLYLDGFGGLAMYDLQAWYAYNSYEAVAAGRYSPKGESEIEAEAFDMDGDFTLRCLLATYNDTPTWFRYLEEASGEFVNGGSVLTLDGYGYSAQSGVYRPEGGAAQYGMFTVEAGRLGTVVRFTVGTGTNAVTTVFRLGDGSFETVGGAGYGEYLKLKEDGDASAPLLILDGNGGAQLWTSTSVHAADGTVTEENGRFVYTQTRLLSGDDLPSTFSFTLKKATFAGQDGEIGVYLVYDAEKVTTLTGPDGSTLTYDSYGYAVYTNSASNVTGRYFILRDPALYPDLGFSILELRGDDGNYYHFRLDGTAFRPLTGTGTYELFVNDFTKEAPEEVLFLSGDGYAALTVDGVAAGGSYTIEGEQGVFTPQDGEPFAFVILYDENGTYYFARHTSLWEGELVLTIVNGKETLTLDGYGEIRSSSGSRGTYYISSKLSSGLLRIFVTDGTADAYFDVDLEKKIYTECGYEVGDYYVYENGTYGDSLLTLDGYGSAVFYEISSGTASRVWEASYEWYELEYESLTLTFDDGKTTHVRIWGLSDGDETVSLCTFEYARKGTYASANWEVLDIGMFGDAVYYDRFGQAEVGTANLLGEDIVQFSGDGERYFVLNGNTFEEKTEGFLVSGSTLWKYLGGETQQIVIPAGITEIAACAFSRLVSGSNYDGAAITSLDLADVVTVGAHAFDGCALLQSVRGEKAETLAGYNFYACLELTEIDLPALKTVGDYAFWRCESLQRIALPKAETLGYGSLGQCYELAEADLPAAVTVEDGAFYDCFALARVTFGNSLVRLGSEDFVTGVFERTAYEADQVPLTVAFAGLPQSVGSSLFQNVTEYRIELSSLETLLSLYRSEAWADYASRAGIATEKDGVYSRNVSSMFAALDLNVIATYGTRYAAPQVLGAYNVEDGMLAVYTYAPKTAEKYVRTVRGKFTEKGIAFDADGYGSDYEAYWEEYYGPDRLYELDELYDSGEKLSFVLNAAETFSIPAEYTDKEGTVHEVSLVSYRNSDGALTMYFDFEGNRYTVGVIGNPANYFEYTVSFVPVVTYYTAADGSLLTVRQNDEAGEDITFSALLAGVTGYGEFRIENETPVFTAENAFTAEFVRDGVNYRFTFTFEGESFSYSYEAEGQTTLLSADKTYRLTVTLRNGEVSKLLVEYYYDPGYEDHSGAGYKQLSNAFFKPLGGNVYGYYVYGEEYADYGGYARYLITLTFDGDTVSAFEIQESGTALRAFMRGPNYAYVYLDGEGNFDGAALFLLGADGRNVYVPHTAENVDAAAKLVTLTVAEGPFANTYYIDYADPSNALLVRATTEYTADTDYGELKASASVTRDAAGAILSASLTVNGETVTTYLPLPEEDFYLFCGTAYYRVRITAADLRVYALTEREVAGTGATADVLLDSNGRLVYVLSVTAGSELSATFAVIGDPSDKTYAILAGEGEARRCFILTTDGVPALEEGSESVYTTADGAYRVSVLFNAEGEAVTVLALGVKNADGGYVERIITEVLGKGEFTVTVVPTGSYTSESYSVTLEKSGDGFTVTVTRYAY